MLFDKKETESRNILRYSFRICDFDYKNNPNIDVVIFAGDIGPGLMGVEWIKKNIKDKPVIYVAGNHEFYAQEIISTYAKIKEETKNTNIHFLQNEKVEINGVTFLGCTLWTDFNLHKNKSLIMPTAKGIMNDYRAIELNNNDLSPDFILNEFQKSYLYLSKNIKPGDVVVTHHAPSERSISNIFKGKLSNPFYASDLSGFIKSTNPQLWVHGHCHALNNYKIGKTSVISNARGYVNIEILSTEFQGITKKVNRKV